MLDTVIWRLAARTINRRFLQSALMVLGVALGVAVVVAIDLANNSASRAFELSSQSITGKATHQIVGGGTGFPSEVYTRLRRELGLRDSAPIVSATLRSPQLGEQSLRLLGIDPFAEPPFRSYFEDIELVGAGGGDAFGALVEFIATPKTAVISQTLAQRYGLALGDSLAVQAGGAPLEVRIVGLLQPDNSASQQALDDLLLTDIASAQELAGLAGRLTRIDLILPTGYDPAPLLALLPDGVSLVNASNDALNQMTAAFEINLQALSLLAVVVGVFLIYNTMNFSVVQRRPTIGTLRALGATRQQIFAIILSETLLLGFVGTVLGLGLGIIFGRLTVGLVAQTISDLYFSVSVSGVSLDPVSLLKGAGLGIFASLGSALIPAYSATQTQPTGSLRRSLLEERTRRFLPHLLAGGVVFSLAGWLLLQIRTESLFVSFGALFCVIIGGALFTPAALVAGVRLLLPLTSAVFGVVGRVAPRGVVRSLSRTTIAVAALTIAVSVIVGVSLMISSFRSTVSDWLSVTLGADIYLSPPTLSNNQSSAQLDPQARQIALDTEGVARLSASRAVPVLAPDYPDLLPVNLQAIDFDISVARQFVWKDDPRPAQDLLDAGHLMVSEPFAFRRGITPENNLLRLSTDSGIQTFRVFGVFYDYSTDQGTAIMGRSTYDRFFDDPFVSSLAVYVQEGVEIATVLERLRENLAGYDLQIQSYRDLRTGALDIFERTFTITIALRLLATLVAFIGILSALMSLQLENAREYGVLRANGMTRGQLWRYTLVQTGVMGTIAGVLALPIGVVLAWVLVFVINVRSFGWTMQFSILPSELITAFMVALVAALLAGIYPAYKLAQIPPARAVRSE